VGWYASAAASAAAMRSSLSLTMRLAIKPTMRLWGGDRIACLRQVV